MSLQLENVSRAVDGVDFIRDAELTFEAGSFNVLLGRTLAGKTSLMRLMAGLDQPDSGRILHNSEDVTGQGVRKRNVSMVYQQFINYPNLTVYENIASPLRLAKMKEQELDRRVKETAAMLHIDNLLSRYPLELSGGQQQRVFMARAMAQGAEILLLDEPFAGVDAATEKAILEVLEQTREAGRTLVVVHHDLTTAADYFDSLVLLKQRCFAHGTPESVLHPELLSEVYEGSLRVFSHLPTVAEEK